MDEFHLINNDIYFLSTAYLLHAIRLALGITNNLEIT